MTDLKKNHHYVPQFWLRGFADAKGNIHVRDGDRVRIASSKNLMQANWLYTLFDGAWTPSDALEDALAQAEAAAAPVFANLMGPGALLTGSDRDELCDFLALQACRHPDILGRGHRRSRDLSAVIAQAHELSVEEFVRKLEKFGVSESDARANYAALITRDAAQLKLEHEEVLGLSPQDPKLPQQDALRAQADVAKTIAGMYLVLLEAPAGGCFILGDTPMPQERLGEGFTVPLSKTLAISAHSSLPTAASSTRRIATPSEVSTANQMQRDNALHVVVGPDPFVLAALT